VRYQLRIPAVSLADVTHDPENALQEAAVVIARYFPEIPERLIAAHVPGPDGRCLGCPWHDVPRPYSPCGLRVIGELAMDIMRSEAAQSGRSSMAPLVATSVTTVASRARRVACTCNSTLRRTAG
jgi:hypothetical protein